MQNLIKMPASLDHLRLDTFGLELSLLGLDTIGMEISLCLRDRMILTKWQAVKLIIVFGYHKCDIVPKFNVELFISIIEA